MIPIPSETQGSDRRFPVFALLKGAVSDTFGSSKVSHEAKGGGKQLWPSGPRRAENVQHFQENNLTGRSPFLGVEMRIFETVFQFLKGAVSDTFGSSKVSHEAKGGWQATMAVGA